MILSTLGTKGKQRVRKGLIGMLITTLFCILFAMIYNHFGHGVYSAYMTYMFLFPLILGGGIYGLILILPMTKEISRFSFNLYNSGIATLTVGSLLKGIFEIAGTSSSYVVVYWLVGIIMVVYSMLMMVRQTIVSQ